ICHAQYIISVQMKLKLLFLPSNDWSAFEILVSSMQYHLPEFVEDIMANCIDKIFFLLISFISDFSGMRQLYLYIDIAILITIRGNRKRIKLFAIDEQYITALQHAPYYITAAKLDSSGFSLQ
ncbi:hypothetical protein ACJX0J_013549, partial [Zea mays]